MLKQINCRFVCLHNMWFFGCASDKHCSSMLVWIHVNFSIRINMWGLFLALSWLTPQSCHRSNMNGDTDASWTLWTWQQFYVNFLPAAWQGVAQYSVQCSTVQYSAVQYSVQWSIWGEEGRTRDHTGLLLPGENDVMSCPCSLLIITLLHYW